MRFSRLAIVISLSTALAPVVRASDTVFDSIRNNDLHSIRSYIEGNGDLDVEENGSGLLHVIAANTRFGLAKEFIAAGINVFKLNQTGQRADEIAVRGQTKKFLSAAVTRLSILESKITKGKVNHVKDYLATSPDLSLPLNSNGDTALHVAAKEKKLTIVNLLLEAGANPFLKNISDDMPGENVGTGRSVRAIVKHRNKLTRLASAVRTNTSKVLNWINTNPSLIDIVVNEAGDTLLHLAAREHRFQLTESLLGKGANIFATNHSGEYPYELTSGRGQTFRALMEAKAIKDTKAQWVIDNNRVALASYLLNPVGHKINEVVNTKGDTLLHVAARYSRLAITIQLVDANANSLKLNLAGKRADQLVSGKGQTYAELTRANRSRIRQAIVQNRRQVVRDYVENAGEEHWDDNSLMPLLQIAAIHSRYGILKELLGTRKKYKLTAIASEGTGEFLYELTSGKGKTHDLLYHVSPLVNTITESRILSHIRTHTNGNAELRWIIEQVIQDRISRRINEPRSQELDVLLKQYIGLEIERFEAKLLSRRCRLASNIRALRGLPDDKTILLELKDLRDILKQETHNVDSVAKRVQAINVYNAHDDKGFTLRDLHDSYSTSTRR